MVKTIENHEVPFGQIALIQPCQLNAEAEFFSDTDTGRRNPLSFEVAEIVVF